MMQISNEDDYKKWLINANMNDNELTNIAVQKLKLKKYCQNNFSNKIDSKFLERKSNLDIIIYSLIRVKDYFKARELYLRILDNEANFGDIAEKYSEGIESKTKGIVGPIELIKTHPQLIEILKSSKPGIINPPKLIEGFYLVTRLESYDSAKLDEFMREKMGEECFNDYIETESQELSQSILNKPLT